MKKITAAVADGGLEKAELSPGPRAVFRLLDLLKLLAAHRESLTLTEVSVALGVSKSTFIDTLHGLTARGFLIQEANRYRLGPAIHRLAADIMTNWSPPEAIRHYVRQVAAETGESVGFAVPDWEIGQVIYIEAVNSIHPVHYAMRAGIRAPLFASASGRVILAHSPVERTTTYLGKARLTEFTPATRTTRESILENLEEIRKVGHCASFGEMLSDTAAIAVPIFGPDGSILGALMLAAPLERLKTSFDALLACLVAAARTASGEWPTVTKTGLLR